MGIVIYTATGCTRCKIVKKYMSQVGIAFDEKDVKADGIEDFKRFYAANRRHVVRGADGVEFPVLTDDAEIRQGIGASIAYLHSGSRLDDFFSVGSLHKEWVDGIHISSGSRDASEEFLGVLRYLKHNAMKLQVDTDGRNSEILRSVLEEGLADVVTMDVIGPRSFYSRIVGESGDIRQIEESMVLVSGFPQHQFQTSIWFTEPREDRGRVLLTAEEIGQTARFIREVTGSMKQPYLLRFSLPLGALHARGESAEEFGPESMFAYRRAARTHQVLTELEKPN